MFPAFNYIANARTTQVIDRALPMAVSNNGGKIIVNLVLPSGRAIHDKVEIDSGFHGRGVSSMV